MVHSFLDSRFDAKKNLVPFVPRAEQLKLFREMHSRNFLPKARKLGMSTAIVLIFLDRCVWAHPDRPCEAANIDYTEVDAIAKLEIARVAWLNGPKHPDPLIADIWRGIHARHPLVTDNAGELRWSNGSRQRAATSTMGTTPSLMHVSELGPLAAQYPDRARKITRGSFNDVAAVGMIFVETTMEGGTFGECGAIFILAM